MRSSCPTLAGVRRPTPVTSYAPASAPARRGHARTDRVARVVMDAGQDDDRFVAYFALVAIGGYTAILAYEFIRLKLSGEI
ncbi:hypothetical protein KFE25_002389 [Diacronema lutheri]|uniref:Uncharacterized protein n=1 Tax=Diacronema lutheri TaxID=2081491 RepID=A0A8J5XLM5_DIALT|nr:hypothetical protein KFE25_002389 [Diacronema lutheri]